MPAVTIYFLIHVKTAMERFGQLGHIYESDEMLLWHELFSAWLHWFLKVAECL